MKNSAQLMLIRNDMKSYSIQKFQNMSYPEAPICVSIVGVLRKLLNLCNTPLHDVNGNHSRQQRHLAPYKVVLSSSFFSTSKNVQKSGLKTIHEY